MKTLIVQIKCDPGKTYDVAAAIVDDIVPVMLYSITGEYDLLGIFQLGDDVDPGFFINKKVHTVSGVASTHTTMAFNAFTPSRGLS